MLDDLPSFVDLAADLLVGEVVAEEDRASGTAEFLHRWWAGVLGSATGEPPQELVGSVVPSLSAVAY